MLKSVFSAIIILLVLSPVVAFANPQLSSLDTVNVAFSKYNLSFWGNYDFSVGSSNYNYDSQMGSTPEQQVHHPVLGLIFEPSENLKLDLSLEYKHTTFFSDPRGYYVSSDYTYNGVRRGYATVNAFNEQINLSLGRRVIGDSTALNEIQNRAESNKYDNHSRFLNFHYDGIALTYAPKELASLGEYLQISYGRGYSLNSLGHQSSYIFTQNPTEDSKMLEVTISPFSSENTSTWIKWSRLIGVKEPDWSKFFLASAFGNNPEPLKLGYIDWFSMGLKNKYEIGPGVLVTNIESAISITHPNNNLSPTAMLEGLGTGYPEPPTSKTGHSLLAGIRYDLNTHTMIGFEYNYGSRNWMSPDTAAGKLGTRGQVYEPFIIQELDLPPFTSLFSKTYLRVGYQHYNYKYTGSNCWLGAPIKISDISSYWMLIPTSTSTSTYTYASLMVHF